MMKGNGGKRLYRIVVIAGPEEMAHIRNVIDIERVELVSEKSSALHTLLPVLLLPIFLALYLSAVIPASAVMWMPLTVLTAGYQVVSVLEG